MPNFFRKLKIPAIVVTVVLVLAFVIFWQVSHNNKPQSRDNIFAFQANSPLVYNEQQTISIGNFLLSFFPLSASASSQVVADNSVRYPDAYPYTDVIQTKSYSKIKEEMILKQPGHPLEFKYQLNIEQYDWQFEGQGNLVFYTKGQQGNELAKLFTIPAPFLIDSKNVKSFDAVRMEMSSDGILTFALNKDWLDKANYPITLDPTVEINIINVHSSPEQGENWTIDFTTQGQADLKIIPNDQATIDDDEFVSLSCDGQNVQPQILSGDVISYPNWQCQGTGQVVHYTKKAGNHTLRFEFGDQVAIAYNSSAKTKINTPRSNSVGNSGLIGYWSFNGPDTNWTSATAGTTNDLSGTGNTATLTNMNRSTSPVAGVSGQALYFDGNNDRVRDSAVDLSSTDKASVSLWMYQRTTFSDSNIYIENSDTVSTDIGFVFAFDDVDDCSIKGFVIGISTGANYNNRCYATTPSVRAWHHYVATYDISQPAATEMQLYIDGILQSGIAGNYGDNNAGNFENSSFNIGGRFGGTFSAHVNIDDVRLYSRVLSSSEIQQLYQSGASRMKINTPAAVSVGSSGLVGYWSFNGPDINWQTSTAFDRSGTGNNGSILNMSTTTSPVAGISGQALKFDGVDDWMDLPNGNTYLNPSAGTIAFWYKADNASVNDTIFSFNSSGCSTIIVYIVSATSMRGQHYANCTGDADTITTTIDAVNTNQKDWHFFTFSWDVPSDILATFYDGTYQTQPDDLDTATFGSANSAIGSIYTGASNFFHGNIDEFRIYTRALTAAEIQQLYQAGTRRTEPIQ